MHTAPDRKPNASSSLIMPNKLRLDDDLNNYHRRIHTAYIQAGMLTATPATTERAMSRSDSAYELATTPKHLRHDAAATPPLPSEVIGQFDMLRSKPSDKRAQYFTIFWVGVQTGFGRPMALELQRQVLSLAVSQGLLPEPRIYVAT